MVQGEVSTTRLSLGDQQTLEISRLHDPLDLRHGGAAWCAVRLPGAGSPEGSQPQALDHLLEAEAH